MVITKTAMAGTLESSDVQIILSPGTDDINITLESDVKKQYGTEIENTVRKILAAYDISSANVQITDKGALDLVIQARMVTAIERADEHQNANTAWEVL